jgi:hypothetical protein
LNKGEKPSSAANGAIEDGGELSLGDNTVFVLVDDGNTGVGATMVLLSDVRKDLNGMGGGSFERRGGEPTEERGDTTDTLGEPDSGETGKLFTIEVRRPGLFTRSFTIATSSANTKPSSEKDSDDGCKFFGERDPERGVPADSGLRAPGLSEGGPFFFF